TRRSSDLADCGIAGITQDKYAFNFRMHGVVHLGNGLFILEIGSTADSAQYIGYVDPGAERYREPFVADDLHFLFILKSGPDHFFPQFPAEQRFLVAVQSDSHIYFAEKRQSAGEDIYV